MKFLKGIEGNYVRKISDRFTSGIPDIIGCYDGRFYAIEVKTPTGKLSKIQIYEMEQIFKAKGLYCHAMSAEGVERWWNTVMQKKEQS